MRSPRVASSASASTSLRAAGNLAPAGTGSSSLYASRRALSAPLRAFYPDAARPPPCKKLDALWMLLEQGASNHDCDLGAENMLTEDSSL